MPHDPAYSRRELLQKTFAALAATILATSAADAQVPAASNAELTMMTILLRHDETKTLDEINAHLNKTGFQKNFPPPGVEVVSWYVMMGRWSPCVFLRPNFERLICRLSTAPGVRFAPSFIQPMITGPCGKHRRKKGGE